MSNTTDVGLQTNCEQKGRFGALGGGGGRGGEGGGRGGGGGGEGGGGGGGGERRGGGGAFGLTIAMKAAGCRTEIGFLERHSSQLLRKRREGREGGERGEGGGGERGRKEEEGGAGRLHANFPSPAHMGRKTIGLPLRSSRVVSCLGRMASEQENCHEFDATR